MKTTNLALTRSFVAILFACALGSFVLIQGCGFKLSLGNGQSDDALPQDGIAFFGLALSDQETAAFGSAKIRMERVGASIFERSFSRPISSANTGGSIIFVKLMPGEYALSVELSQGENRKSALAEKITLENGKVTFAGFPENTAESASSNGTLIVDGTVPVRDTSAMPPMGWQVSEKQFATPPRKISQPSQAPRSNTVPSMPSRNPVEAPQMPPQAPQMPVQSPLAPLK